jgi:PAS domain-containing protein
MQRMVELFDEPAYVVDRDLTIIAWNHGAEQAFGWGGEDAIGHSADERLRPAVDWRPFRDQRVRQLFEWGWWAGPTGLLDRQGRPLAFQGFCCEVFSVGVTHYFTVLHQAATNGVANLTEKVAKLAFVEDLVSARSSGFHTPILRPRQSGGFQAAPMVERSTTEMSATHNRQTSPADAARRSLRERKTFAIRMRIARDERRWTQDQMGDFLRIRSKEINRFEHAHTWGRPPSHTARAEFAIKLGKPRDWFVTEVESDDRLEQLTADEEASLS